jgi:purine-cytosine permease-like protein
MRWSTFLLTVMGTIVVPLIGVIITGYFMLRAAGL